MSPTSTRRPRCLDTKLWTSPVCSTHCVTQRSPSSSSRSSRSRFGSPMAVRTAAMRWSESRRAPATSCLIVIGLAFRGGRRRRPRLRCVTAKNTRRERRVPAPTDSITATTDVTAAPHPILAARCTPPRSPAGSSGSSGKPTSHRSAFMIFGTELRRWLSPAAPTSSPSRRCSGTPRSGSPPTYTSVLPEVARAAAEAAAAMVPRMTPTGSRVPISSPSGPRNDAGPRSTRKKAQVKRGAPPGTRSPNPRIRSRAWPGCWCRSTVEAGVDRESAVRWQSGLPRSAAIAGG
jgi:hypothetical protein